MKPELLPAPATDEALVEVVRNELYEGLSWFGTLPEPEGDVPERYHRWNDLGEFAERIIAAMQAHITQREQAARNKALDEAVQALCDTVTQILPPVADMERTTSPVVNVSLRGKDLAAAIQAVDRVKTILALKEKQP